MTVFDFGLGLGLGSLFSGLLIALLPLKKHRGLEWRPTTMRQLLRQPY